MQFRCRRGGSQNKHNNKLKRAKVTVAVKANLQLESGNVRGEVASVSVCGRGRGRGCRSVTHTEQTRLGDSFSLRGLQQGISHIAASDIRLLHVVRRRRSSWRQLQLLSAANCDSLCMQRDPETDRQTQRERER